MFCHPHWSHLRTLCVPDVKLLFYCFWRIYSSRHMFTRVLEPNPVSILRPANFLCPAAGRGDAKMERCGVGSFCISLIQITADINTCVISDFQRNQPDQVPSMNKVDPCTFDTMFDKKCPNSEWKE